MTGNEATQAEVLESTPELAEKNDAPSDNLVTNISVGNG